jgi:uncharacterized protein
VCVALSPRNCVGASTPQIGHAGAQIALRRLAAATALAICAVLLIAPGALAQSTGRAPGGRGWQPPPERYGETVEKNVELPMSDGVTLRANVHRPTDPATGEPVPRRFPVLLMMTPYSKDGVCGCPRTAPFVKRGYLAVKVDVRGTGVSRGAFELFGPREIADSREVIDQVARLPNANGKVGMIGDSYLGVAQFFAARAVRRRSPLKALFPGVAGADLYRFVLPGGLFNAAFNVPYAMGLEFALHTVSPLLGAPPDELFPTVREHLAGNIDIDMVSSIDASTGGDRAYEEHFWRSRAFERGFKPMVRKRIPAFVYNAWFDIWSRDDVLVYSQLQNAWARRPMHAPMRPRQKVSGRYQVVVGPWAHNATSAEGAESFSRGGRLALQWFDRFLKGHRNGIDKTATPLHVYQVQGRRWVDTATWPLRRTSVRSYHLAPGRTGTTPDALNDGRLDERAPTEPSGEDQIAWEPASSPCNRNADQRLINGPVKATLDVLGSEAPCVHDDRTYQTGALTYTTEPFPAGANLAGPSSLTLLASSSSRQAMWTAVLEDVGPGGSSRSLASGALLGSFRSLNRRRSWKVDGRQIRPYVRFNRSSERPLIPGAVERFHIELTPILARIAPGHRLRLTLRTSDFPYLLPLAKDVPELLGSTYRVQRNSRWSSVLNLPFVPSRLGTSPIDWGKCATDCGQPYRDHPGGVRRRPTGTPR